MALGKMMGKRGGGVGGFVDNVSWGKKRKKKKSTSFEHFWWVKGVNVRKGRRTGENRGRSRERRNKRTTGCCLPAKPICLLSHHLHQLQTSERELERDEMKMLTLTPCSDVILRTHRCTSDLLVQTDWHTHCILRYSHDIPLKTCLGSRALCINVTPGFSLGGWIKGALCFCWPYSWGAAPVVTRCAFISPLIWFAFLSETKSVFLKNGHMAFSLFFISFKPTEVGPDSKFAVRENPREGSIGVQRFAIVACDLMLQ